MLNAWRRVDQRLGTISMVLLWTLGLWMANQASWLTFGWMRLKLVAVVLLSGLHGLGVGVARRMATDPTHQPALRMIPTATAIAMLVAATVTLVVIKPT